MAAATKRPAPIAPDILPACLSLAPLNMGEEEADIDGEVLLIEPLEDGVGIDMLPMLIFGPTYPNQSISHTKSTGLGTWGWN